MTSLPFLDLPTDAPRSAQRGAATARLSYTLDPQLYAQLQAELSQMQEARIFVVIPPAIMGLGIAGGFQMQVEDREGVGLDALQDRTQAVIDAARRRPEIGIAVSTFRAGVPQIYLDIDRVKAEQMGVKADDIFRICEPRVAGLAQEVFIVVGMDIRNGLLDVVEVARGSVHGVEVHPREVFRPLIRMAAAAAVVVHNHPSGDPTPSLQDVELTRRLIAVGELLGIPVIDHVVIGDRAYRSVKEHIGTEP